jgi:hypothetical protein
MLKTLDTRIEKGVKNFFENLRIAFATSDLDFNTISELNIFLAGNSSKSLLVKNIFDDEIKKNTEEINKKLNNNEDIFKIFQPLGNNENSKTNQDLEKPTGKTGVAFGLLKSRKGGKILVVDHNVKENDISFKFYLGVEKKGKFRVEIDRENEYNKWIEFIDAMEDTFELFYSSQSIVTTGKILIDDNSIKKIILKIDKVDDEAMVYIRIVSPNEFEYVVAYEDEIENNNYLSEIIKFSI